MTRSHGLSHKPEFVAWYNMVKRCTDPDHPHYHYYGGREITIYEPWLTDPHSFIEHMGPRPSALHSLDRINNDENYEPGNVKWSTKAEQISNRRVTKGGVGLYGASGLWFAQTPCYPQTNRYKWLGYKFNTREAAVDARESWLSVNWPDYPNGEPVTEW